MTCIHRLLTILLAVAALCACDRSTTNNYYFDGDRTGTSDGGSSTTQGGSSDDDTGDDDDGGGDGTFYGPGDESGAAGTVVDGILTVAEALRQDYGAQVTVEAYVVGASSSTVKKTVFEPPFPSSANLVLADHPYTGLEMPTDSLMQVKLTEAGSKELRNQCNLKDHPEHHNRKVQIEATLEQYYKRMALVYLSSFQWVE